jgi:prepilin-type N-terminal cleavage/methylation domain-containing protein
VRRGPAAAESSGQAGFTLPELLVVLIILVEVLAVALLLFDFNNRLSRVQTNVTEMQQSLRVARQDVLRMTRMAGRGGLGNQAVTAADRYQGFSVQVRNNAAGGARILPTDATSPRIVEGTDVLTVRGVFNTPLYQLDYTQQRTPGRETFVINADGESGYLIIESKTPSLIPQDLRPLLEVVRDDPDIPGDGPIPEALVLMSPQSEQVWGVVELTPGANTDLSNPDRLKLGFKILNGTYTGTDGGSGYSQLRGPAGFPTTRDGVVFAGILEEYRYYLREEFAVPGDPTSASTPRLSRARVYPNTDVPHRGSTANLQVDVADFIYDFQVALGLDSANGGAMDDDPDDLGADDQILETADGTGDDWLFNAGADNPVDPTSNWATSDLYYIRITTVARTDSPDPKYQGPILEDLEDHSYAASPLNTDRGRMYRRRVLRSVIDLRSL